MIKNNKGSIADLFLVLIAVSGAAIFLVVGYSALSDMIPEVRDAIGGNYQVNDTINASIDSMATFDYFVLAIYMGLLIALILTAFLVDVHPAFMFIFILIMVLAIIVSVPLSNAYQTIQASLGVTEFTMTDAIMNNLPLLTAAMGFIFLVVNYVKERLDILVRR